MKIKILRRVVNATMGAKQEIKFGSKVRDIDGPEDIFEFTTSEEFQDKFKEVVKENGKRINIQKKIRRKGERFTIIQTYIERIPDEQV